MNRRELSPRYALTGSSRTPVERSTQHSLTLPSAKKHPQSISPASCLQHRVLMFYNGLLFPLRVVPCGHPSPYLRRCLERFDRFCKAHDRDRQTDQATDKPRSSVCNNRPHQHSTEKRPKTTSVIAQCCACFRITHRP